MSFWTPVENPGTRPLRSWVFDIGCALLAALGSFGSYSFGQAAHPPPPTLTAGLVAAVLTTVVISLRRVWPGPVFGIVVPARPGSPDEHDEARWPGCQRRRPAAARARNGGPLRSGSIRSSSPSSW